MRPPPNFLESTLSPIHYICNCFPNIFFSLHKRPNCCGKPLFLALKKQSLPFLFIYLDLSVYVCGAVFGPSVNGLIMTDGTQQPLGLGAFWMRTL